jgi:hypothetical protein
MSKRNVRLLHGDERLYNSSLALEKATVLDFWRWAFSDLQMNNVRGIFAEWLVSRLLDIPLDVRDSWQEWDLKTPEGVTIEVKTSAYVQAWPQRKESKIVFTGLKSRRWYPDTNKYAEEKTYHADLYVFCVQVEKDPRKWDALDLGQWRFYLVTRDELAQMNQESLSLSTLAQLSPEMTADEFRTKARLLIESIASASTPSREG